MDDLAQHFPAELLSVSPGARSVPRKNQPLVEDLHHDPKETAGVLKFHCLSFVRRPSSVVRCPLSEASVDPYEIVLPTDH